MLRAIAWDNNFEQRLRYVWVSEFVRCRLKRMS
jgi:hypothetical protein